ncbi:MAG: tetratricopeptide repeat protein [Saprospiraceae bacterium]|nr:tetratricopeptide repeat protein [Saprospiraceae bacterium]MDW8228457.1 tetratricopeptide repeat protein [Saprospiraceae bacterium]
MKKPVLRIALCVVSVWLMFAGTAFAQPNPELANQYFKDGEYEKAAEVYRQLIESNKNLAEIYFDRYLTCLLNLERYEEAENALKKQIKRSPGNTRLYVSYGNLYERMGKTNEAQAQYEQAIASVSADYSSVYSLAEAFAQTAKFDYAIRTYERGNQLAKDPRRFAFQLAEIYRRKGDTPRMIEYYLSHLEADPSRMSIVQTQLARYLPEAEYPELQRQLYARLQNKETAELTEMLAWTFVQRKDYKNAMRQYRALDKRLNEVGQRVFQLANDAANARDYDAAIAGYEYIIQEKGRQNPFFFSAKGELMKTRRRKITEGYNYTQQDLQALENDYEQFIAEYGVSRSTAMIIIEQAELEALYINNLPKAIQILETLINTPGIQRATVGRAKINLADYYLMSGDIWESTLLYSQVDKEFREEMLGQEARFKNARLSYFNGDFEWAQAQFDALKASTSKLLSNDAIDLSVFIMDNLNTDATTDAMAIYAQAELLVFQNRFAEALYLLDSLRTTFPETSLQDDVLYLKAQIAEKKREYQQAADLYAIIAEKYPEDIRADNALYARAILLEERLGQPEKAMELYEKIFVDYSSSVYAVDARKRFRILRGDKVQ